jgi:histidinol-phosphatase (PHP family)
MSTGRHIYTDDFFSDTNRLTCFRFSSASMKFSNYHTHCDYCDGKGTLRDYQDKASRQQIQSIGFSSHAPLPFPRPWSMKAEDLSRYIGEVADAKKSNPELEIYCGLEVDYIPGITGPSRFQSQLDYTIGSVHFVDAFPDGTPWEIDGTHTLFLDGLQQIFHNDIQAAITRYFEITRSMVAHDCPDVIGHLDKIKIQNRPGSLWDENDNWYRQEVIATLDAIARSGAIVEVNTRGLYQKKSSETYPGNWALQQILQKKIPITLSSDAHHPEQLTKNFSDTLSNLYTIGFRELMVISEGRWKSIPLATA